MIHAKIKNNKGEQIPLKIPQGWEEISIRQLLDVVNGGSEMRDSEKIATFTRTSKDLWLTLRNEELYHEVRAALAWSNQTIDFKAIKIPKSVKYKDHYYDVPTNLKGESIAQFEDMRAYINKYVVQKQKDGKVDNNVLLDCYPVLTAIYMQPLIEPAKPDMDTGLTYSYGKAMKLSGYIKEHWPCTEVSAVGGFFLTKHLRSQIGTTNYLQPQKKTPSNLMRGLRSCLRFMGFTPRSTL